MNSEQPEFEVAVIGAGPGGIAAGVKLLQAGVANIVLLERADDVGGSWHENHYPGLGVDVPSFAYQYSFARNPRWSRLFPKGAEVKQYHVDVAKRFGVYERVRFNTNVEREEWDDEAGHWKLHASDGTVVTARFLVSAVGAFVRPKADIGIAGANSFGGKIQRPTDWDHEFDMAGKSVGIIGTGASAVQIIPTIAPEIAHLTVFQRTPVWSLPKPDLTLGPFLRPLYAAPGVQSALNGAVLVLADVLLRSLSKAPFRWSRPVMDRFDAACIAAYRRYIRWVVDNPATAEKLTPNFGPLAKRPTISNGYLKAYNRNNVTLVTEPIARITKKGVRTRDGVEHRFDVLILATGYEVFSDPETYRPGAILGRNGFDLANYYGENGLQAYESVAVHGLPNRWTLCGPYSWTGSGWHAFMEMTSDHAVRAILETNRRGADRCEVRKEIADAYHHTVKQRSEAMRYYLAELNGHVPTYYRNSQGDSTYLRPAGFFEARRSTRDFPLADYVYEKHPAKVTA
ncbi:NAD(P)/FAD-dependent oxidoreductase [Mycobacteroides abscessus subsp. bolletii]|uniref:flavin-containing monooxygenase n=1 Tax=Mycobacteroides abscessus TaxID=36809 RepID=UPI000D95D207|nr:NAD(P)/FAD-dependent oxidoreductase [Mycobacteroides abscessus]MDO3127461.1 NAD(P)/FAD-dependent oxidoreductase [Mycobacteroides abscessus subsp. bolletii]SPX87321.1 putative monooxygenase [Mycobacteroides abscessus]